MRRILTGEGCLPCKLAPPDSLRGVRNLAKLNFTSDDCLQLCEQHAHPPQFEDW